jgi:hypothetical protein
MVIKGGQGRNRSWNQVHKGRSNSPDVAGDVTRLFDDVPWPTGSTWFPAPSSATGTSASTTADRRKQGCCAVQRPRRMTRRARFAMSTHGGRAGLPAAAARQTTDTPMAWATRAGSSAGTTQPRCSPTSTCASVCLRQCGPGSATTFECRFTPLFVRLERR